MARNKQLDFGETPTPPFPPISNKDIRYAERQKQYSEELSEERLLKTKWRFDERLLRVSVIFYGSMAALVVAFVAGFLIGESR